MIVLWYTDTLYAQYAKNNIYTHTNYHNFFTELPWGARRGDAIYVR